MVLRARVRDLRWKLRSWGWLPRNRSEFVESRLFGLVVFAGCGLLAVGAYAIASPSASNDPDAEPLLNAGIPREVLDAYSGCADEEAGIDMVGGCSTLAVPHSSTVSLRIATGSVATIAGHWSGSDATAAIVSPFEESLSATSRNDTWSGDLPDAVGSRESWVQVAVDLPAHLVGHEVAMDLSVLVRHPVRRSEQIGNITTYDRYANVVETQSRQTRLFVVDPDQLEAIAKLSARASGGPVGEALFGLVVLVLGIGMLHGWFLMPFPGWPQKLARWRRRRRARRAR